jgi:hypothetical protein
VWKEIRDCSVVQNAATHSPSQDSEPCRVTGRQLALESAHIIPTAEKQWFGANRMDQYGELGSRSGDSVADTATNRMRFTCDAHRLFDSGYYTITPKTKSAAAATAEARGGKTFDGLGWYTHMLNEHEELYTHWHNINVLHFAEQRESENRKSLRMSLHTAISIDSITRIRWTQEARKCPEPTMAYYKS